MLDRSWIMTGLNSLEYKIEYEREETRRVENIEIENAEIQDGDRRALERWNGKRKMENEMQKWARLG